jgi:hypothetical protein
MEWYLAGNEAFRLLLSDTFSDPLSK